MDSADLPQLVVSNVNAGLVKKATKVIVNYKEESTNFYTTVNLYLLDEMKTPMMKVAYSKCWLKELGELQLNYEDGDSVLKHSFTCYFNDYTITDLRK